MKRQKPLRWSESRYQAMSELAGLFPTLDEASGVRPWNASKFIRWAIFHCHCSGSAHAVRFLLSVWNPDSDWRDIVKEAKASHEDQTLYQTMLQLRNEAAAYLGKMLQRTPTDAQIQKDVDEQLELFRPFNLSDAIAVWDAEHRAAVSAWIADPFWP